MLSKDFVSPLHNARKAWLARLSKGCQLGDYDVINTNVFIVPLFISRFRNFILCSVFLAYSAICSFLLLYILVNVRVLQSRLPYVTIQGTFMKGRI